MAPGGSVELEPSPVPRAARCRWQRELPATAPPSARLARPRGIQGDMPAGGWGAGCAGSCGLGSGVASSTGLPELCQERGRCCVWSAPLGRHWQSLMMWVPLGYLPQSIPSPTELWGAGSG